MHRYRTHNCNELRPEDVGVAARLSGWIHRRRDHGQLVFLDLRDHFGITQCVVDIEDKSFSDVEKVRVESVVTITGKVLRRDEETINPKIPTGHIELRIETFEIQSSADLVPLQVNADEDAGEELRLRYRFLDLRRERIHNNIITRSNVISSIRRRMIERGFVEFQTPILTASSPEGARDFLVPSRLHPGKFYALPQAPQQFKQLVMMSGFDRYFQIAPCFRDEDSRADRSPGEFYQLDLEMSFVEQEDVFSEIEPVLAGVFEEFSTWSVPQPFPRIPFSEALMKYGTDKPDLRIPIEICDVSDLFADSEFAIFAKTVADGGVVRALPGPKCGSRAICDRMNSWAQSEGAPGMGYIILADGEGRGPIASRISKDVLEQLKGRTGMGDGDAIFFSAGKEADAAKLAGNARLKLGDDQGLIESDIYKFCWVVDFPMFEKNEVTGEIEFSHNPFSMPQGGLEALENKDPLDILAYQYDIVCNGIELSSGAIRNHLPDVMIKAFSIAGYSQDEVEERFSGMLNAFRYGAPPHGGFAPGIDRIVMLIADEPNIREVILFPMNQKAEDLMMNAPGEVDAKQLKELNIRSTLPPKPD
ncbi:MAG: aspartate--tRNA ligase [Pseudomonadota bacterium]|nr:aspartate--tRNA ligase [Rhodospirillaceae bacterium]MEC7805846.1 aspartate--tRNA ligase [Pseudomonadota bacterium]MEC9044076.1 aspartate--tRNA ligase [Pseudomonadota bacterium]|tara:strand:- start:798 stop:2567 length:1770 start_codon:yes stop_codon:yes gene_type:complete